MLMLITLYYNFFRRLLMHNFVRINGITVNTEFYSPFRCMNSGESVKKFSKFNSNAMGHEIWPLS